MFSVEEYKLALTLARNQMHEIHYAMLRAQYSAPNRTITPSQLADAIGYSNFSGVNLHYGRLGRFLATALGQFPKRRSNGTFSWWRVLSSGKYISGLIGFHWTMHASLATALEELDLVNTLVSTIPEEVTETSIQCEMLDCERLLSEFDYERDIRRPPDNRHKGRFRAGWKDALSPNQVYTKGTLKRLTWHNLGYRLGKRFGQITLDQVDEVFDLFSQQYSNTASRRTQKQKVQKIAIVDLEATQTEESRDRKSSINSIISDELASNVPTVETYCQAFSAIREKLTDNQLKLLQIHHSAPARTIMPLELAKNAGYPNYSAVNLQYGLLAKRMCDVLNLNLRFHIQAIIIFIHADPVRGETPKWIMRPQVAEALERLGLVSKSTNVLFEVTSSGTRSVVTELGNTVLSWQSEITRWVAEHRKVSDTLTGSLICFFELAFGNTRHPECSWFGVHKQTISLVIGGIFLAAVTVSSTDYGIWLLLDKDFSSDSEIEYRPVKSTQNSITPLTWAHVGVLEKIVVLLEKPEIWQSYSKASDKILNSPISKARDSEFQEHRQKKRVSDIWTFLRASDYDISELNLERQRIEAEGYFNVDNLEDARRRVTSSIVQRQGQSEFRRKLLNAYGSKCPITDCNVEAAIEAAHIIPYLGTETNHIVNGLPLRADIHILFDLHLLSVRPDNYEVIIAPNLLASCYREFAGRKLTLPENELALPDRAALTSHYELFLKKCGVDSQNANQQPI